MKKSDNKKKKIAEPNIVDFDFGMFFQGAMGPPCPGEPKQYMDKMAVLQKQKHMLGEELKKLQEMDGCGVTTIKGSFNVK